jgi:hypothetical protein
MIAMMTGLKCKSRQKPYFKMGTKQEFFLYISKTIPINSEKKDE